MEILVTALMIIGGIVILVGSVFFLIAAFRESLLWGLACIFVPFAALVFLVIRWSEAKVGFLIQLGGSALVALGVVAGVLFVGVESTESLSGTMPDGSWTLDSEGTDFPFGEGEPGSFAADVSRGAEGDTESPGEGMPPRPVPAAPAGSPGGEVLPPLHAAARNGEVEAMKALLQAGVPIDEMDRYGDTPLHKAAIGGHPDTVRFLIEQGADVNRTAKDEFTPLHLAAQLGHAEVVRALLENRANPAAIGKNGATALTLALERGHAQVVKLLSDAMQGQ